MGIIYFSNREVIYEFNNTFTLADNSDSVRQLFCLGIGEHLQAWYILQKLTIMYVIFYNVEYPEDCDNYYGPHSMECLKTMWNESKCVVEGYQYPQNLSTEELQTLDILNIRYNIYSIYKNDL